MNALRDIKSVLEEMHRVEEHRTRETPLSLVRFEPPNAFIKPTGPKERLESILFHADTIPVEIVVGVSSLLWGIWFLVPVGALSVPGLLLPLWCWGLLFVAAALFQIHGALLHNNRIRRFSAMSMFLLWTFALLVAVFNLGVFIPTSLLFALTSAWIHLRCSIPS